MIVNDIQLKFKNIKNFHIVFSDKIKNKKFFQRCEFLGDRVIAVVIAEELYKKFKDFDEGKLAKVFSFLTSAETLERIAKEIKLDILLLKKNNKNISRKVLSDCLEALLGSLYIDGGIEVSKSIILKLWKKEINKNKNLKGDIKSLLQEWTQANNLGLPVYKLLEKSGPDHSPYFHIKVKVRNFDSIIGKGKNLQEAQKKAAKLFVNTYIKENLIGKQ